MLEISFAQLRQYLNSIPSGAAPDVGEVERLLVRAWDAFHFEGDETGMAGHKLRGRMEDVRWNPPFLSFSIERHGATVLGSTRAELHDWRINVEQVRAAVVVRQSFRQVSRPRPPLYVEGMVDEVASLIVAGKHDQRLRWREDGSVQVLIGKLLPKHSAVRETLAGRRKRFARALRERLAACGWTLVVGAAPHTYRRAP